MPFDDFKRLLESLLPLILLHAAQRAEAEQVVSMTPLEIARQAIVDVLSRYEELKNGNPRRPDLSVRKGIFFVVKDRAGSIARRSGTVTKREGGLIGGSDDGAVHDPQASIIGVDLAQLTELIRHSAEYGDLLNRPSLRVFVETWLRDPEGAARHRGGLTSHHWYDARSTAQALVLPWLFDRALDAARARARDERDRDRLAILDAWSRGWTRLDDVLRVTGLPKKDVIDAINRHLRPPK